MKKSLLLCSLLCLAILEMYGQKQPRAMVHDEIANRFMPERHMNDDSLFMRRHNQGSMMSGKMDADRAELLGRHNMDAEQRLNAVKKADRENIKGDGTFVDQSDSLALVALYNSTNGPGWSNSTNWLTGPVSTWYGVDVLFGKVFSIDLFDNSLYGSIPPEMGSLDSLQYLHLGYNQLSGAIPHEIGNLTSLQYLYLWFNQLSGTIPHEIGSLASIQDIDLWFNQLSGAIPPEIGNLTSLQYLDLSHNQLSGAIPPEMGNLTSLQYLYLNSNQLSDLPNLSAITNLEGLVISYNQFTFSDLENSELNFSAISTVHYSPQALLKITSQTDNGDGTSTLSFTTDGTGDAYQWFNGSSLIENATTSTLVVNNSNMGIYYCKVTNPAYPDLTLETKVVAMNTTFSHGVFEDEYNILVELYNNTSGNSWISKYNWLSNNDVDEWYGVEVSGGHVTSINLYSNNLAGTIPPEIGNLDSLKTINLSNNQLSGSIPPEIGNLASLQYLYLNSNQLSGAIPTEIGNLNSLKYLYLNSNQLSGAIPTEIGNLNSLKYLYLNSNQLSGAIPTEIGNLNSLKYLYLNSNQLSGVIPPEMGNLTSLQYLYLYSNQLSGSIPPEMGNLTSLQYLYLYSNQLSGAIPPEIGSLTSLQYLYLNSNQLSGAIPTEIGNLNSLKYLYLNSNQLSGAIPSEIGNLNSLKYLYLNSNQLSGAIPSEIGSLTNLVGLYLYNNQLSDLPNLSASLSLGWLNTSSNHLTFEDIEPNLSISYFNYSPQARVGSVQHYTPNDGDNLNISVSVGGANNTYQWYRDGAGIPGATGSTYSISSYSSVADAGVYVCRIQNSMATELTLESYCIYVGVDVPTYTVDVSASPVSSGTVSGGGTYEDGQTATVSATPSIGYWFASWTSNGTVVSTSSAYSFVVTGNTSLVANFKLKTYAVSATPSQAGSGTVTGAGTYSHGASVTLVATPNTGYRFASWTSNGTEVSTSSAYSFVVTGNTSLVANFELKTYAVSATSSPAGSGTVTGAGTYSHGASVTLEATPITGYRFASWTSNGTEVSTSSAYTFVVTGDTSLVANFEDITGIIEDGLKESISIYPNPTNRHITVSGEGADMKSIAVYDFMGRLRGRYNVNTDEAIIDFTGYPSGVYLVVVKTNTVTFTKKIVRE